MLLRLACSSALAAALGAAEDGITTTTTENGVTTVTTTEGGVTTITTTSDQGPKLHTHDVVAEQSPLKFELFSGARFGGITGGSILSSLRYETRHHVWPEAQALVGVSGTKFTLGPRFDLRQDHWTLDADGLNLEGNADTAISLRGLAAYRWSDRDRAPSFWHGIVGHEGWYFGGEVSLLADDIAFDLDITWRQNDPRKPQYTLAYGVDF